MRSFYIRCVYSNNFVPDHALGTGDRSLRMHDDGDDIRDDVSDLVFGEM